MSEVRLEVGKRYVTRKTADDYIECVEIIYVDPKPPHGAFGIIHWKDRAASYDCWANNGWNINTGRCGDSWSDLVGEYV